MSNGQGLRIVAIVVLLVLLYLLNRCGNQMDMGNRPDHSSVDQALYMPDGTCEFAVMLGKAGTPKLALAEVPAEQLAWPPGHYADSKSYQMRFENNTLIIGKFRYPVRKIIELPEEKQSTNFLARANNREKRTPLPAGGSHAGFTIGGANPGHMIIDKYEVDSALIPLIKNGHLVVAAIDPDGTFNTIYSLGPLDRIESGK